VTNLSSTTSLVHPRDARSPSSRAGPGTEAFSEPAAAANETTVAPSFEDCQSAAEAAQFYAERCGWYVFPVGTNKRPIIKGGNGFVDATREAAQIRKWWDEYPDAQVAVACTMSGLLVVDLDLRPARGINGIATFAAWRGLELDGADLVASTPTGGMHLYFSAPAGAAIKNLEGVDREGNTGTNSGIDIRTDGYVILPSPASIGRAWTTGAVPPDSLSPPPPWLLQDVLEHFRKETSRTRSSFRVEVSGRTVPLDEAEVARIRRALSFIDANPRTVWRDIGMALKSTAAGVQAYEIWCEWSQTSPKFDPKVQAAQWASFREFLHDGSEITIGTLFHHARAGGYDAHATVEVSPNPVTVSSVRVESADAAPQDSPEVGGQPAPQGSTPPFPTRLIEGDDLLSMTAQWILRTALYPQPALALGNAIPMLGSIVGRRVQGQTRCRTNFYVAGIAPTGAGKEHSQKCISELLVRSGLQNRKCGGWKSSSAIITSLASTPSQIVHLDEFGQLLRIQTGVRTPHHLADIRRVLLTLFGISNGMMTGECYADPRVNPSKPLIEPCLSYYGASTPGTFFAALESDSIADGFLNRHLVFIAEDHCPVGVREFQSHESLCSQVVSRLIELDVETRTRLDAGQAPGEDVPAEFTTECRTIPFADGGKRWFDVRDHNSERRNKLRAEHDRCEELWTRYPEHVAKLALLHAIARTPRPETVTDEDLDWAVELASWCHTRMHSESGGRGGGPSTEAAVLRVLRIIAAAGPAGIAQNQLTRKCYWLTAGQRREILDDLVRGEAVICQQVASATKPTTIYIATGVR
jgi:hypothetical protein